jgi:hypothetical protein
MIAMMDRPAIAMGLLSSIVSVLGRLRWCLQLSRENIHTGDAILPKAFFESMFRRDREEDGVDVSRACVLAFSQPHRSSASP